MMVLRRHRNITKMRRPIAALEGLGIDPELIKDLFTDLESYYKLGKEMADQYINHGTEAGNEFMGSFDTGAQSMNSGIDQLMIEANKYFENGSNSISVSLDAQYKNSITLTVIILLFSTLTMFALYILIIRKLTRMSLAVKDMNSNGIDLTIKVPYESKDELGSMAVSINQLLQAVQEAVGSVKNMSVKSNKAIQELNASLQQSLKAAEETGLTMNEIATGATDQADNASQGSDLLHELGEIIRENKTNIDKLHHMAVVMADKSKNGLTLVAALSDKNDATIRAIGTIANSIENTDQNSKQIMDVLSFLTSIADQTNLLSLNASIEAARAGEHGKGFAVVSNEIKKLADQSGKSSKRIEGIVHSLLLDISSMVKVMEEVEQTVRDQSDYVGKATASFKEIADIVTASSMATEQINIAENNIEEKKQSAIDNIQLLSAITEENSAVSEQVSAAMQEQVAAFEEIANASNELEGLFTDLMPLIERFRI